MHRVVGDRTCAPWGAFTVAGLCRDLTGFATTRVEWPRYHGGRQDGPCVRWRLRSSLTHLGVRSLRCSPPPWPGPSCGRKQSGRPKAVQTAAEPLRPRKSAAEQRWAIARQARRDKCLIRAGCEDLGLALLPPSVRPPEEVPHGGGTMAALVRAGACRPRGSRAGRLDDTRCRDAAVGSELSAAGRQRSGRLRRTISPRRAWRTSTEHRGTASIRSSTAMGRWPVNGSRSGSTATRAPGSSTCRPSRSPPGRSGASS